MRLFAACTLALLGPALSGQVQGQTFSNTTALVLPSVGSEPRSSLYPSPITVSGGPTSIGYLCVTLYGVTHDYFSDVNVLLVAPDGQKIMLLAHAIGSNNSFDTTLSFTPDATAVLPASGAPVESGVYACSAYNPNTMPTPAPGLPYGTSLAPLIGTNANGTWQLFVADDFPASDGGSLTQGWSISFSDLPISSGNTAFTYQGRVSSGASPISGAANVRFTLCSNALAPTSLVRVGTPITRSFTNIAGGLITTALDFGSAIDTTKPLWLNVEVENPPGAGFIALSSRQALSPTPKARMAQSAATATSADTAAVAATLVPGRARIVSDAGAVSTSPGLWLASPIISPVDRTFIGQRDDNNVGIFTGGAWNFMINANGNTVLGDATGAAPPERLTINGGLQINTSLTATPNRLNFGPASENTDPIYFERINTGSDVTELRLAIGNNPSGAGIDSFRIVTTGGLLEQFRFQSDGVAMKPGGGAWTALSDPRAKHDIAPLSGTLDKLLNLRGYSFQYNADRIATGIARPGTQIGLMADEVERVFPDWVSTDATGTRYVTERATTALMVEALRDLRAEKDAAAAASRAQLESLKAENAAIKERLERLERLLTSKP